MGAQASGRENETCSEMECNFNEDTAAAVVEREYKNSCCCNNLLQYSTKTLFQLPPITILYMYCVYCTNVCEMMHNNSVINFW